MTEPELEQLKKDVEHLKSLEYLFFNHQHTGSDFSKLLENARIRFRSLDIGGNDIVVRPGDNIQAANDEIAIRGQGKIILGSGTFVMTANLNISAGVSLVGQGVDDSILDFGSGARGVNFVGTAGSIKDNFEIRDLTIQNSNNAAGLDIQFADFWVIDNVKIFSCDQAGLRIQDCQFFTVSDSLFQDNTGNGVSVIASNTRNMRRFEFRNCTSLSNSAIGYSFNANSNDLFYGSLISCRATTNTGDGYDFAAASGSALDTSLTNCVANSNGGIGFDVDSNSQRVNFVNCFADTNTGDGFEIAGQDFVVTGCYSSTAFDLSARGTFVGNHIAISASTDPKSFAVIAAAADIESFANSGANTRTNKRSLFMKNTSGGTLTAGTVVILKSVATGDEVTTTTTGGDNKVFGVVDTTVANDAWGPILVEGFTATLKVDGTTDIAIGDYLTCFTTAGIAAKAAAGNMVFAMALEAYTTNDSSGVIDALIIPPRLI